ncbi:hypothetical protein A3715_18085 [Oleiphilus sp. HI0009]|nr:hypothetical protein A3715_18085 [Oleiphilus sp. HI0009]
MMKILVFFVFIFTVSTSFASNPPLSNKTIVSSKTVASKESTAKTESVLIEWTIKKPYEKVPAPLVTKK